MLQECQTSPACRVTETGIPAATPESPCSPQPWYHSVVSNQRYRNSYLDGCTHFVWYFGDFQVGAGVGSANGGAGMSNLQVRKGHLGAYVCGSWVSDMWSCAKERMSRRGR